jgi:hypothetical protein
MRSSLLIALPAFVSLLVCGCAAVPHNDFHDRDAVLNLLAHGEVKKATKIAQGIVRPAVLAGMRVDNRFAPVIQAMPKHFDIELATEAFIAQKRAARDASPRSLRVAYDFTQSLLDALRYSEALEVTSSAVEKIEADKKGAAFDDLGTQTNWLLNQRADAFRGLNQWNEANNVLAVAVNMNEGGETNVSQIINLASMHAKMGLPELADQTLSTLRAPLSKYGAAQEHLVRLIIAEQTNDREASQRAFEYLKSHQSDSVSTLQIAMLEANRLDEAATFLISRLRDPALRLEALYETQDFPQYYAVVAQAPARVRLRVERWLTVTQRRDVQDEIAAVGKIERFNLAAPF